MDFDLETGKTALKYFHNASTRFAGYKLTFDQLLASYGKKADIYAEGIGLTIRIQELSDSRVRTSMVKLASVAQGRIPKDHLEYNKFLSDEAAEINFLDATASVIKGTAIELTKGAGSLGDSLISGLSTLNVLLPFLMVGGVLFIFSSRVKQLAGKK